MNTKYFFYFLLVLFTLCMPRVSLASKIFFEPATPRVPAGELVKVNVYVDTEGDQINAVEGKLFFQSGILSPYNLSFGNSILNFWVEEPHKTSDGVISASRFVTFTLANSISGTAG